MCLVSFKLCSPLSFRQDEHVIQGLECIRNGVESEGDNMNTYTLAISSYALGLGEYYTTQSDALDYLNQRAQGEGNQLSLNNTTNNNIIFWIYIALYLVSAIRICCYLGHLFPQCVHILFSLGSIRARHHLEVCTINADQTTMTFTSYRKL